MSQNIFLCAPYRVGAGGVLGLGLHGTGPSWGSTVGCATAQEWLPQITSGRYEGMHHHALCAYMAGAGLACTLPTVATFRLGQGPPTRLLDSLCFSARLQSMRVAYSKTACTVHHGALATQLEVRWELAPMVKI